LLYDIPERFAKRFAAVYSILLMHCSVLFCIRFTFFVDPESLRDGFSDAGKMALLAPLAGLVLVTAWFANAYTALLASCLDLLSTTFPLCFQGLILNCAYIDPLLVTRLRVSVTRTSGWIFHPGDKINPLPDGEI